MGTPAGVVEDDRFARQRAIPDWDQERVGKAAVVVAGVGALGNEVAKNLALAGVGRLVLCDPDTVAASNLSRTVLFGPDDVGRPKVRAAADALRRLAPGTETVTRPHELTRAAGLGELADAAAVIGCLDSRHARLRLLGRCALAGAALVDGGTHPWGGEVRLRVDPADGCYGCTLTPGQRAEDDLPAGCLPPVPPPPAPASIVATSIVAGWLTLAALRLVLGRPPGWRLLDVDGFTGSTAPVAVRRDPACPHHEPLGPAEPVPVGTAEPVAALLARVPDGAEPLAWRPFAVPTTCRSCGAGYRPPAGHPGGVEPCPACGAPVRLRRSERLRAAGPTVALHDLGVAPGEIIPVRLPEGRYRWLRLAS
ncbi:ThiF family adenylyltransferase [Dactylosporangium sp. NPDC049525]|uniref:ThiF family adenylyltransferase n=1 Tax=Dactylosporangium sp. NPDC049525 TaxID=3154730 RepID=UPI003420AA63